MKFVLHNRALGSKAELPMVADSDALLLAGSDEEQDEEARGAVADGVDSIKDTVTPEMPGQTSDNVTSLTAAVDKCTTADTDNTNGAATQPEKSPKGL